MQKNFEVTNMKGGITDEYIESDARFVEAAENLCMDQSGDIVQRPGSHFLEGSVAKDGSFVSSGTAVTHTAEFDFQNQVQNYLACIHNSGDELTLKQLSGGALTSFDFDTPFFTPHSNFNSSVWQAQPFFANGAVATGQGNFPIKVTVDKLGQLNVISAGLPKVFERSEAVDTNGGTAPNPPSLGITLEFREKTTNFLDTCPIVSHTVSATPTGASNEFRMAFIYRRQYYYNGVLYEDASAPHYSDYISLAGNMPLGNTTGQAVMSVTVTDSLRKVDGATWQTNWNSEAFLFDAAVDLDSGDNYDFVFNGYTYNDDFDSNARIKISMYRTTGGGNVFYEIGHGGTTSLKPTVSSPFFISAVSGSTDMLYIFSSTDPVAYDYGFASRVVYQTDAELQLRPTLYTTSGQLPNDLPGRVKFNDLVNDNYMYWVEAANPYRVRQATYRDPDSVPLTNFIDFPEAVTGISSAADKLIVCTLNSTYRVDGFFDDFGRGSVVAEKISSETGCLGHNSMVRVADGLFFCGIDGFYYTNGQTVMKVSRHLGKTYYRLTQSVSTVSNAYLTSIVTEYGKKINISENQTIIGTYDKVNNRLLWSFNSGTEVLILEKSYGINEKMVFMGPWSLPTSRDADVTGNESIYAKTIGTFKNKVVRTDNLGNILQLEDGVSSDPRPYTLSATPATNWLAADRYPILYRLRTQASYLGSKSSTKIATRMSAVFKRATTLFADHQFLNRDLDVQITSINDKGRVVQDLKPVHYSADSDAKFTESKMFGSGSYTSLIKSYDSMDTAARSDFQKDNDLIKITRRFIAKGLRCVAKALEFKPALRLVAKSDDYETVAYNGAAASLATFIWSKFTYTGQIITTKTGIIQDVDHSAEGYYLALEHDNYRALYPINSVSGGGDTVTLGTAFLNYDGVVAPSGTYKWKLYAFPKNQFFGLCSYTIMFAEYISGGDMYRLGGNAGDKGEP
jgi:hypothetical protein